MIDIRRLDPVVDEPLFYETYQWLLESPDWRRETESVFGTLEYQEYMKRTHEEARFDIGVFLDEVFVADVVLLLRGKHVYEIGFEAKRGTPAEVIVEAGISIRNQMWDYGMQLAVTWTPRWNRAVLAIDKAIGFRDEGVTMMRGQCRGRIIEWVQLTLVRKNNEQQHDDSTEYDPESDSEPDSESGLRQHLESSLCQPV